MRIVEIKLRYYARKLHAHKPKNTEFRTELIRRIHEVEHHYHRNFIDCPDDAPDVKAVERFAQHHAPDDPFTKHRPRYQLPASESNSLDENIIYLLDRGFVAGEIADILAIDKRLINRRIGLNPEVKAARNRAKAMHEEGAMWIKALVNNR